MVRAVLAGRPGGNSMICQVGSLFQIGLPSCKSCNLCLVNELRILHCDGTRVAYGYSASSCAQQIVLVPAGDIAS
jgi:hypothetical protein